MPLPVDSFKFSGGCNCRAVRYRADVPHLTERPFHPWSNENVRLPFAVLCHCEDCRRASGALAFAGFCSPIEYIQMSLLPRNSTLPPLQTRRAEPKNDDGERMWVPAMSFFGTSAPPEDSFLSTYQPSIGVTRSFCSRCGTNISYSRYPVPAVWPNMLDILVGTVDREHLEKDALAPERHLWWNSGISWVHKLYEGDGGLPRHPITDLTKVVGSE